MSTPLASKSPCSPRNEQNSEIMHHAHPKITGQAEIQNKWKHLHFKNPWATRDKQRLKTICINRFPGQPEKKQYS
jgi:hypothetical protein